MTSITKKTASQYMFITIQIIFYYLKIRYLKSIKNQHVNG